MIQQRGAGTKSYSKIFLVENLIILIKSLAEARRAHNPEDARSKLAVAMFFGFRFFWSSYIRSNNALRRGYVFCKCFYKFGSSWQGTRESIILPIGEAGARVALLWASFRQLSPQMSLARCFENREVAPIILESICEEAVAPYSSKDVR